MCGGLNETRPRSPNASARLYSSVSTASHSSERNDLDLPERVAQAVRAHDPRLVASRRELLELVDGGEARDAADACTPLPAIPHELDLVPEHGGREVDDGDRQDTDRPGRG